MLMETQGVRLLVRLRHCQSGLPMEFGDSAGCRNCYVSLIHSAVVRCIMILQIVLCIMMGLA